MTDVQIEQAPEPEMVPIDYSRYRKADLQEMCRQRTLPTSGNLVELIDRLGNHDRANGHTPMVPAPAAGEAEPVQESADLDFMVEPDENQPQRVGHIPAHGDAVTVDREGSVVPPQPAPQTAGPGKGVSAQAGRGELTRPGVFSNQYPCPTELTTEAHNRFLIRIAEEATAAGHEVRGGAFRSGWSGDGDSRQAVYEVLVRKV